MISRLIKPICPSLAESEDCPGDWESGKDVVLIDSLFIMDQFKAAERVTLGKPHTKDIAEVTAVAEAVLPKGSARISPAVRRCASAWGWCLGEAGKASMLPHTLFVPTADIVTKSK